MPSCPSSSGAWDTARPRRNLLQESFARSLDKVPLDPEESVTAWFYRVLRNGIVDHYRRKGASERALASLQKELEEAPAEASPDERDEVCRVTHLSETLKPEYALALRRVEVDGVAVRDFASEIVGHPEQRRGAPLPRPRDAAQAGGALVRCVRRAGMRGLFVRRSGNHRMHPRGVRRGDRVVHLPRR